jgi:hypothetical protein
MSSCEKTINSRSANTGTTQTEESAAAAKQAVEKNSIADNAKTETDDYEGYTGLWSMNGLSHDAVISNGGVEFSIQITDRNNLNGYLFTQQGTSERIAEIDQITGKIINGECNYGFNDDGWGGSGILHITFSKDTIQIEVQDYKMKDTNLSGYRISGVYQLDRSENKETDEAQSKTTESQTSEQQLLEAVQEKYYSKWTEKEMQKAIKERKQYREKCSFYPEAAKYLEEVREVTDISSLAEPLYYTDMKIYEKQDFDNVPPLILYLAKNEIYARHGYIFKNKDLMNYFKGQIWYEPSIIPEDFDDSIFNKNEQANLKLLSSLDTYMETSTGR